MKLPIFPPLLVGLLLGLLLHGQASAAAQAVPPENLPDLELLEFLGTFEDRDTGWLDPFEIPLGDDGARDDKPVEDNSDER
jgi:hypothetical protein